MGLGLGLIAAGAAQNLWQFSLAQGILIGLLVTSATFAPLVADTSRWFTQRWSIALAIGMSGNCLPRPELATPNHPCASRPEARPLGLPPGTLQVLLRVAGVSCCVTMSMPHGPVENDLGFGTTRGAAMLSVMRGMGIASRPISGWISDQLGGLRTLLPGAVVQGAALLKFLPFDGLVPRHLISGMFGLFQGGITPSYALIVREHFPPAQAGARGHGAHGHAVRHGTGRVDAGRHLRPDRLLPGPAFITGIGFNLLNIGSVRFLLKRARASGRGLGRPAPTPQRLA